MSVKVFDPRPARKIHDDPARQEIAADASPLRGRDFMMDHRRCFGTDRSGEVLKLRVLPPRRPHRQFEETLARMLDVTIASSGEGQATGQ